MPDDTPSIVENTSAEAPSSEKRDFRQEVTNNVISMLEKGTAPWQRPWDPEKGAAVAMPFNPTSEKTYQGGNAVHLMAMGLNRGYQDPRWLTYRQAQAQGWQVRAGEKGTQIEFWQFRNKAQQGKAAEGKEATEGGDGPRGNAPLHRIYTVFNASQIEGIPAHEPKVHKEWEVVKTAENILAAAGVPVLHDQPNRAYYTMGRDEIHMPPQSAFATEAKYYGTALHELGHATGHPDRLNRETLVKSDGFGGPTYAKEELRAELTSLFLAAERGIPHDPEQHAAYVDGWLDVLKKDKNEIFRAAKDASKATDFLLDKERQREQELGQGREPEAPPKAQDNDREPRPGQERGPDGTALEEVIVRETSEHIAEFDPDNGAVVITEKNTAEQERELFDATKPTPGAERPDGSVQASQEQILDGVVDGRAAPTGMTDPAAQRAASLSAAKALAERELGSGAKTMNALTDSGRYSGPILGSTSDHLVQGLTPKMGIIHETNRLSGLDSSAQKSLLDASNANDRTLLDAVKTQEVLIEYHHGAAHIQPLELNLDTTLGLDAELEVSR